MNFLQKLKTFWKVVLMMIVSVTLLGGCDILPKEEETLAPPLLEPQEIAYKIVKPTRGYIENSITCTGTFIPVSQSDLYFENISGRLKSIEVKSGDVVKIGTILAQLVTDHQEDDLAMQKLVVESCEEAYLYAKTNYDLDLENAQKKLVEKKTLYENMLSKAQEYSNEEFNQVKAEIEDLKLNLEKLTLSGPYDLKVKSNNLEMAKLKLEQTKKNLEACSLLSTIDGVVTYTANVNDGEYVDAFKVIVSVADPKIVELQYSGDNVSKFIVGMEVEVKIKKTTYKGTVVSTPGSSPTKEELVKIQVENPPDNLSSAARAEIKVVTESSEDALIIPKKALKTFAGKGVVYILEDNLRVERYVETGIKTNNEVQIINGLGAEDNIIVE